MNLNELFESLRTENPCWKGYHPVGTKKKNGRTVPNCVPNANEGVVEGAGNIGAQIRAAYQKIYNAGDDAVEFAYNDSPIFAQYWDEYEGDLDSIIAEVDPSELQVILAELTSAVEDQGLAEGAGFDKWADERAASQLHKLKPATTWVLNVMDEATGEHWAIEIQASSPDMAKERARQQGYKVLRIKEKVVAEDDAGDVEQRMIAKIEKEKQRLAKLKQTDPEAYKREMAKRKTSGRVPPVSTFEEQGVAEGGNVFMPGIQNTPEYKAGFATGKLPVPHPEGTQEYASYYKGVIDRATPNLQKTAEGNDKVGNMDADRFDDAMSRLKQLAGQGPLKTVWDPQKRVYRNVPVAQQPKQQPSK